MGAAALLLVGSGVVCLGAEFAGGSLLHATQNARLALLLYPVLYILALYLLAMMAPSMEKSTGWDVPALIVMPISALAVMHLVYSGLDQRTLHANGREIRATVADTYWVDQGRDAPLFVAALKDPSGRPVPGRIYGKKVTVGQSIIVTVDPQGKIPPSTGRRPTGSRTFLAAGVSAAVEILFLAWAAFRGTAERLAEKATDGRPQVAGGSR